ncbi:MAG: hypothetical protein EOO63_12635 [Hymenobacter sp.]|nr:MAG: hypothetical protein EOO63_12635 [Hymenobacter sp.]
MLLFTNTLPRRAVALVSAAFMLVACSKKDDATPTSAATTYATTWTADGTNYTANNSTAQVNNSMLSIIAQQATSSSNSYSVSIVVPAAAGTYTLSSASPNSIAGYTKTVSGTTTSYGAGSAYGGSGTVTVTTYSATEVIGTFSLNLLNATTGGTAGNGATITNGKFAIKR